MKTLELFVKHLSCAGPKLLSGKELSWHAEQQAMLRNARLVFSLLQTTHTPNTAIKWNGNFALPRIHKICGSGFEGEKNVAIKCENVSLNN